MILQDSFSIATAGTETSKEHVNQETIQVSDLFIQDRLTLLNTPGGRRENMGNRLRTYNFFKQVFQKEFYLTCYNY